MALLALVAVIAGGCSSKPEAEPVSEGAKGNVQSSGTGGAPVQKSGGATPDTNVYAAPAGVKTGVEGGRK